MARLKYQKRSRVTWGVKPYQIRKAKLKSGSSSLKRRRLFGILLFAFLVLAAGSSIIYYLLFSSSFRIKNIEILGAATISESEITESIRIILNENHLFQRRANYFTLSAGQLSEILRADFPKVEDLTIDKVYPNTLRLTISERAIEGIWCSVKVKPAIGECFYIDKEGVIFENAPKSYGAIVFLVFDERDFDFKLGNKVLNDDDVVKFKNMTGIASRNFSFGLKEFAINEKGNLEIQTSENWKILLGKDFDAKDRFSNLKYVLDEEIKEKRGNLEYVDLRLGNRIYYKMKN